MGGWVSDEASDWGASLEVELIGAGVGVQETSKRAVSVAARAILICSNIDVISLYSLFIVNRGYSGLDIFTL